MPPYISVRHFGPDLNYAGGMATVIRTYLEFEIGADATTFSPTWRPSSHVASARLTRTALHHLRGMLQSELVHVHLSQRGSFAREGSVAFFGRRWGHPVVATIHGSNFLPFASRFELLTKATLRQCHAILCLSSAVQAKVSELAPGVPVELVANPVELDPAPTPIDHTSEVILFAGELSHRKGLDVLLAAWRLVRQQRPYAQCIVAGPPRDVTVIGADGVRVHGSVDQSSLRAMIIASRAVVLPSRAEGMPMILTEALASARPIVATPVGGIPELLREGGLQVEVGDAQGLAAAIVTLLEQPELAQSLGERGWQFCQRTRSPEVIGRQVRSIYEGASVAARPAPTQESRWAGSQESRDG